MKNIFLYIGIIGMVLSCIAFSKGALALSGYSFVVGSVSLVIHAAYKCLTEDSIIDPFGSGPFGSSLF